MTGFSLQLRAFSEVHQAMQTTADPMAGLRKALPALSELFQARHAAIDLLPLDGGQPELIEILHPEEVQTSLNNYPTFVIESPSVGMIRAGGFSPVLRISDHLSQRQFEQTGFYREVFSPAGWKDQLGFAVQLPGAALGVTFQRDRFFNDDEAGMALHLQRYVAERFASRPEGTEADPFRNAWRIPLDASGDALILPLAVRDMLNRFFVRSEGEPGALPNVLQHWIRGLRRRREHTRVAAVCDRIVIDRPKGRLHVGLKVATAPLRDQVCLSEEQGRHDFYRLKALRLTERESEVIFWITQGKSDADIALILGTAHKTINKHVENVLLKLAANNRTSAAVRAVEWLADPTVEFAQRW
jgi:DNA-binding CsgD family transcriptional regulator